MQCQPVKTPEKRLGAHSYERRTLPAPFDHAHGVLTTWVQRSSTSSHLPTVHQEDYDAGSSSSSVPRISELGPSDTWLPEIYQFSSIGLSLDDRYATPSTQPPTPFVASLPRVAESKAFNFDHGDLTVGLVEETSYMAWF